MSWMHWRPTPLTCRMRPSLLGQPRSNGARRLYVPQAPRCLCTCTCARLRRHNLTTNCAGAGCGCLAQAVLTAAVNAIHRLRAASVRTSVPRPVPRLKDDNSHTFATMMYVRLVVVVVDAACLTGLRMCCGLVATTQVCVGRISKAPPP